MGHFSTTLSTCTEKQLKALFNDAAPSLIQFRLQSSRQTGCQKPEAFEDQSLVEAVMFHPRVQHSAQMAAPQLLEMGSLGSQAVCPKAMKMAFYDGAQLTTSCSCLVKVKKGSVTQLIPIILHSLILWSSSEVNNIRCFILAFSSATDKLK